jgi:D-3-phosphoglycerate dehydrogenase / 2-oxoglutarate reductase
MGIKVALVGMDHLVVPRWVDDELARNDVSLVAKECRTASEVIDIAADADVVWVLGGNPVLHKVDLYELPRCRAILRTGAGTDNIPEGRALEAGILIATTPSAGTSAVAEHVVALILDQLRQVTAQDHLIRRGTWDRDAAYPRWRLEGQVLGLIGCGRIARALIRKLQGFELSIMAFDPYVDDRVLLDLGVTPATLHAVLRSARVVSLHCPLSQETFHLIGESELRLMRPDAILINVARGSVVDEVALIRALKEGWITSAGLDVFATEPLGSASELLNLPNTVLTPHIGGYSDDFVEESWRLSVEVLIDLSLGQVPASYVAPNDGSQRALWRPKTDGARFGLAVSGSDGHQSGTAGMSGDMCV